MQHKDLQKLLSEMLEKDVSVTKIDIFPNSKKSNLVD